MQLTRTTGFNRLKSLFMMSVQPRANEKILFTVGFERKKELILTHFQEPGNKPSRRRQLGEASDAEHYSSNESLSEDDRFAKNNSRPSYTKQHSKTRVSYN